MHSQVSFFTACSLVLAMPAQVVAGIETQEVLPNMGGLNEEMPSGQLHIQPTVYPVVVEEPQEGALVTGAVLQDTMKSDLPLETINEQIPLMPGPVIDPYRINPEYPPDYLPEFAPGYATEVAPEYAVEHAPGYVAEFAPGYTPGYVPGYVPQHAPEYVSRWDSGIISHDVPGPIYDNGYPVRDVVAQWNPPVITHEPAVVEGTMIPVNPINTDPHVSTMWIRTTEVPRPEWTPVVQPEWTPVVEPDWATVVQPEWTAVPQAEWTVVPRPYWTPEPYGHPEVAWPGPVVHTDEPIAYTFNERIEPTTSLMPIGPILGTDIPVGHGTVVREENPNFALSPEAMITPGLVSKMRDGVNLNVVAQKAVESPGGAVVESPGMARNGAISGVSGMSGGSSGLTGSDISRGTNVKSGPAMADDSSKSSSANTMMPASPPMASDGGSPGMAPGSGSGNPPPDLTNSASSSSTNLLLLALALLL